MICFISKQSFSSVEKSVSYRFKANSQKAFRNETRNEPIVNIGQESRFIDDLEKQIDCCLSCDCVYARGAILGIPEVGGVSQIFLAETTDLIKISKLRSLVFDEEEGGGTRLFFLTHRRIRCEREEDNRLEKKPTICVEKHNWYTNSVCVISFLESAWISA